MKKKTKANIVLDNDNHSPLHYFLLIFFYSSAFCLLEISDQDTVQGHRFRLLELKLALWPGKSECFSDSLFLLNLSVCHC